MTTKSKAAELQEKREELKKMNKELIQNEKTNLVFDELGIPTKKECEEMAENEPLTTDEIINAVKKSK